MDHYKKDCLSRKKGNLSNLDTMRYLTQYGYHAVKKLSEHPSEAISM